MVTLVLYELRIYTFAIEIVAIPSDCFHGDRYYLHMFACVPSATLLMFLHWLELFQYWRIMCLTMVPVYSCIVYCLHMVAVLWLGSFCGGGIVWAWPPSYSSVILCSMKITDYIVCIRVQWALNLTRTKMCSHASHPEVKKEVTHFSQQLIAYSGFIKFPLDGGSKLFRHMKCAPQMSKWTVEVGSSQSAKQWRH